MGDLPGHEFHGNQWTNRASSGGGNDTRVSSGDYLKHVRIEPVLLEPDNKNYADRADDATTSARNAVARLEKMGIHVPPGTRIMAVDEGVYRALGQTMYTYRRDGSAYPSEVMLNVRDAYWDDRVANQGFQFITGFHSSADRDHVALHELGHAIYGNVKGLRFSADDRRVARTVGRYAGKSAHEFVAEVFAGGVHGRKFSAEVKEMYVKFKGPYPEKVLR